MRAKLLRPQTSCILRASLITFFAFGTSAVWGGEDQSNAGYKTETILNAGVSGPQSTQDCKGVSEAECRKRAVETIQTTFRQKNLSIQVSIKGENNEIIVFDSAELFGQQQSREAAKDAVLADMKEVLCSLGFQKVIVGPSATRPTYWHEFDLNCSGTPDRKFSSDKNSPPTPKLDGKTVPSGDRATGPSDKQVLSKDYRKSATTAMSSIEDWRDKAKAVTDSMNYSSGHVYVNRTAAERESDAARKAALDVKLAKVDASEPADKDFQKRLEIYLDVVKVYTQAHINLESGLVTKDVISRLSGCEVALKIALDEGSTKTFAEHPDTCNPDSD